VELERGKQIGAEIIAALSSACVRATIAGSVRRKKKNVKDLEVVYIAQTEAHIVDLFGNTKEYSLTDQLIEKLIKEEFWIRDRETKRWGPKYKRLIFKGEEQAVIELFRAERANWGLILALRTGPAEFNHILVSHRRGAMPGNMVMHRGWLWREGQRLETPTEDIFFAEVGLPYWKPENRNAARLRKLLQERSTTPPQGARLVRDQSHDAKVD